MTTVQTQIVTVPERKRREAERRTQAAAAAAEKLKAEARRLGGRYILHGSAAKGCMRYDSDIDLVLDFPSETEAEAWRLAEDVCRELDIPLDILPFHMTDGRFRETVAKGVVLS